MQKGTDLLSESEKESVCGSRGPLGWESSFGARTQGLSRTRSDKEEISSVFVDSENMKTIGTHQRISDPDKLDDNGHYG